MGDQALASATNMGTSGATAAFGITAAAFIVPVAALGGGTSGRALGALALALPGVLLQDAWRYCFVAMRRPRAALLNDSIWCISQVAMEFVTAAGAAQAVLLGFGVIAGLAALDAVRGAQVFFGPINVLF